jgi:hypothetical protein
VYTKWVESSGVQVHVEKECRCVCGGVCAVYGESERGLVVCRCVCEEQCLGCVCGVWRRECVVCEGGECVGICAECVHRVCGESRGVHRGECVGYVECAWRGVWGVEQGMCGGE